MSAAGRAPFRPARGSQRLVVVSNRLPFAFRRDEAGRWRAEPGGGGLVTALLPVLRHRGGMWIGWTGAADDSPDLNDELAAVGGNSGYTLKSVPLSAEARAPFESELREAIRRHHPSGEWSERLVAVAHFARRSA